MHDFSPIMHTLQFYLLFKKKRFYFNYVEVFSYETSHMLTCMVNFVIALSVIWKIGSAWGFSFKMRWKSLPVLVEHKQICGGMHDHQ